MPLNHRIYLIKNSFLGLIDNLVRLFTLGQFCPDYAVRHMARHVKRQLTQRIEETK